MQSLKLSEGSSQSSGAEELVPIKRPDNGGLEKIRNVNILVNHFPVRFNPESIIRHYNIEVKPGDTSTRARPMKISKANLSLIKEKLFSDYPEFPLEMTAFDGEKNIFSAVELPIGCFTVRLSPEEDVRCHTYKISVTLVNELKLRTLKNYLTDEYASCFKDIDPVSQYKNWTTTPRIDQSSTITAFASTFDVYAEKVKAAFVVSDPVDWGRDIQVLCDILRTGLENGGQPVLYFAADDLEYQAAFPAKRLGVGAFRIALESIFNRVHHTPLEFIIYGKPEPLAFKNAEATLRQLHCHMDLDVQLNNNQSNYFRALYMVGDNPSVDIKGARQAGDPWIPVLTRTGMFQGKGNHTEYPADLVMDTVEDAVDYILEKEFSSGHSSLTSGNC